MARNPRIPVNPELPVRRQFYAATPMPGNGAPGIYAISSWSLTIQQVDATEEAKAIRLETAWPEGTPPYQHFTRAELARQLAIAWGQMADVLEAEAVKKESYR